MKIEWIVRSDQWWHVDWIDDEFREWNVWRSSDFSYCFSRHFFLSTLMRLSRDFSYWLMSFTTFCSSRTFLHSSYCELHSFHLTRYSISRRIVILLWINFFIRRILSYRYRSLSRLVLTHSIEVENVSQWRNSKLIQAKRRR